MVEGQGFEFLGYWFEVGARPTRAATGVSSGRYPC
jgi:hypothetical protein